MKLRESTLRETRDNYLFISSVENVDEVNGEKYRLLR